MLKLGRGKNNVLDNGKKRELEQVATESNPKEGIHLDPVVNCNTFSKATFLVKIEEAVPVFLAVFYVFNIKYTEKFQNIFYALEYTFISKSPPKQRYLARLSRILLPRHSILSFLYIMCYVPPRCVWVLKNAIICVNPERLYHLHKLR